MSLNDNFEIVLAGGEDCDEVVDVGVHRLGSNEWFYDDFLCGVWLRTLSMVERATSRRSVVVKDKTYSKPTWLNVQGA